MKDSTSATTATNFTAPLEEFVAEPLDLDIAVDEVHAFANYSDDDEIDDLDHGDPVDSWSYEVPRPWLTMEQAASMLGRSARGVERSILGKWGNHLPEGWSARRVRIDGLDEWRIVPPPGFRIKHNRREQKAETSAATANANIADVVPSPVNTNTDQGPTKETVAQSGSANASATTRSRRREELIDEPFSLEKFLQSAGRMAQKELASFGISVRPTVERTLDADVEHATIVIDRSDEVEKLLRELSSTQRELAEQRRMHLEDLRAMKEMQSSLLLLEVRAKETSELKQDLTLAQQALKEHRTQYQEFLALPWYKRLFSKLP